MSSATNLRDAASLRAMAHPTRLRLIELLRTGGPQTGAMLATQVDEAAGTVSYHLRTLESAGIVRKSEPRSADRRAQWWEAAHQLTHWDSAALASDPETADAARELDHLVGQIYAQSWSAYVDSVPQLEAEWVSAATSSDRALSLTAAQLAELSGELTVLAERWQGISDDQTDATAQRTMLITQAYRRAR